MAVSYLPLFRYVFAISSHLCENSSIKRSSNGRYHRVILLEMDLIETADSRHAALLIGRFPGLRRIKLRLWACSLQQGSVFRWTTQLEAPHGWTIELAIAFQTDQHAVAQFPTGPQRLRGSIGPICDDDHLPRPKERFEVSKLVNGYSHRRLCSADPFPLVSSQIVRNNCEDTMNIGRVPFSRWERMSVREKAHTSRDFL